jgi:hypothetical protein
MGLGIVPRCRTLHDDTPQKPRVRIVQTCDGLRLGPPYTLVPPSNVIRYRGTVVVRAHDLVSAVVMSAQTSHRTVKSYQNRIAENKK